MYIPRIAKLEGCFMETEQGIIRRYLLEQEEVHSSTKEGKK